MSVLLAAAFVLRGLKFQISQSLQTPTTSNGDLLDRWDMAPFSDRAIKTYEFRDDGSATITLIFPTSSGKGSTETDITESYRLDGNNLVMRPIRVRVRTTDPAEKLNASDQEKSLDEKIQTTPAARGTVTWMDKDTVRFSLTTPSHDGQKEQQAEVVLKRRKDPIPELPKN